MGKEEHDEMGKKRNYLMPPGIGYTPGTGGAMELMDFIKADNDAAIRVVLNEGGVPCLVRGYNYEEVCQAYSNASDSDRKLVQEQIANFGVDQNMFLALNATNMYADGQANDFQRFVDLVDENKIDCKKACQDLNRITARALPQRSHAFSVRDNLKEGTPAWINFKKHDDRSKAALELAHTYLSDLPGYSEKYIDKEVKEQFLGNGPDEIITLEEAFEITKEDGNLRSLEQKPRPLFGNRLYSKNQTRKNKNQDSPNQVWM